MSEPQSDGMKKLFSAETAALPGEEMLKVLHTLTVAVGASDIHFSPQKDGVRLECRVHGVLRPVGLVPHAAYVDVIRRVKFLAKLKLNITNIPQDGQYTFEAQSHVINMRVASLPSRFGEALTLRLLDPARGIIPLEKLGFPEEVASELAKLMEIPNGLVLVTGPTGSGKTTTLYALLSTIVGKERNIITLEDPIEYELAGITQSQIDPDHDYAFGNGLRAALRHDPDVILVGEIRDQETAQTAINAALTGHLVLSTLHTNSAIEAIPRLLSMGVSPYTFAPAIRAVLSQRLVRTLTHACSAANAACDPSAHESYDGQMALPELLLVTPAMRGLILNLEQGPALEAQAKKEKFVSMGEWGKRFVAERKTTKEEVARVSE